MAVSALWVGSDGPARPSHKANAELTFKLDHWMGADHRTEGPCLLLATGSRMKRVQWSGWERVEKPPNPVGDFGSALEEHIR